MPTVREYISYRYKNWLDYANHLAITHHFEGWEADLLNDVIVDLLSKPEAKTAALLRATTRKTVNGTPTTELDKFVLAMLKMNATSSLAPFRKNTLGQKILIRTNKRVEVAHTTELNGYDTVSDEYSDGIKPKLDRMHAHNIGKMRGNGYTPEAIELYERYFMKCENITDRIERDSLERIKHFLIIT